MFGRVQHTTLLGSEKLFPTTSLLPAVVWASGGSEPKTQNGKAKIA